MDQSPISKALIAGLAATLFFSISFILLEYTIKGSIIFGVIGGISAGLLGFWLQIESRPEIPEKEDAEPVDSPAPSKPKPTIKPWPKTPKERSGVSVLSWFLRHSQISSKSRKKY
ncbi:MAG: hypothetical protein F6K40_25870 [Okeania sp. SIO3I5]|uniref:hypothetical protein n=1 Tax=Okeania sp. SIO3I5 TaxID=2607805 RepID=UPI0013BBFD51|nr:hypothetical protein [Okeania sp. SIO3I5]NEQ39500.1 hypothetical protein [Okeania sp. SIO3I5]